MDGAEPSLAAFAFHDDYSGCRDPFAGNVSTADATHALEELSPSDTTQVLFAGKRTAHA